MKTVMCAVNANYYHSPLSLLSLKRMVPDAILSEHNINQPVTDIVSRVYMLNPDVVCFSCYIFNIEYIRKIAHALIKILPKTCIIAGGIEITNDTGSHGYFDYIVKGEGEYILPELLINIKSGSLPAKNAHAVIIEGTPVTDLNLLPFPYTDEYLKDNSDKLLYYESSRGCPFRCSYCNSADSGKPRDLSVTAVFRDIDKFIEYETGTVKFVDRTFNYNINRAKNIWKYISDIKICRTVFHFECKAELFDKEAIAILNDMPHGRIQLEIGIQSNNLETLKAVCRNADLDLSAQNITALLKNNNFHVHLDLIAGLPHEDFNSFKKSFDYVYELHPHHIQVGILKMLKGAPVRNESGYVYSDYPPYEIMSTPYLTFEELLKIKKTAYAVEKYYNSGIMRKSLEYIIDIEKDPFNLFRKIGEITEMSDSKLDSKYLNLQSLRPDDAILRELLIFDFLSHNSSKIPARLSAHHNNSINSGILRQHIFDIDVKTLEKRTTAYIFDYSYKDPVTGLYKVKKAD